MYFQLPVKSYIDFFLLKRSAKNLYTWTARSKRQIWKSRFWN